MNSPRLDACYFGAGADGRWDRFARVLRATAQEHCPRWTVRVQNVSIKIQERGKRSEAMNTAKLEYWAAQVEAAQDGDQLLLIDVDTFIRRPLDEVWSHDFDLAYTTRSARFPFNGGVVFVNVSAHVKAFFRGWVQQNGLLLERSDQAQPWRQQFGGINQAALGRMFKTDHGLRLLQLPCGEWNCEDTSWASFDPAVTRIVHLKGALRMACVETQPVPPGLKDLASLWKAAERSTVETPGARAS